MAFSNSMTKLMNKIERRLGTRLINPYMDKMGVGKKFWDEPIIEDSIQDFSRFFPDSIEYTVTLNSPRTDDGYIIVDESFLNNKELIGVQDLDFRSYSEDTFLHLQDIGYGFCNYQALQAGFTLEDVANVQMAADVTSLFNQGIYVVQKPPNMFRLESSTNINLSLQMKTYKVKLLCTHDPNLLTIPPTQMIAFENLATSDVGAFIYNTLQYVDESETIYATIKLHLERCQQEMEKREQIIETLDAAHVSAANDNCPMIITI